MPRKKRTSESQLSEREQKFIDLLLGDPTVNGNATEALMRLGYTNRASASRMAYAIRRRPAVIAEIEARNKLRVIAREERVKAEAEELGRCDAVTKAAVLKRLWQLATLPLAETKSSIQGQVRASVALAEILGMKIGPRTPDKFEGFSDHELADYAKNGTVPERFSSRFGLAPQRPADIM
ncbi:MAG TPA: hypothetical protein VKZ53_26010 [Candidatus Angelobacter sp.]|nr:hypothetical protein [Candidatus Angelobacter sp.]